MTPTSACAFSLLLLFPGLALPQSSNPAPQTFPPALIQSGESLFQQDCAFCHGRDAAGGETGPDLTRSKLVNDDIKGEKIGAVVRNGRPDAGMPRFSLTDQQIAGLTAYIHNQKQLRNRRRAAAAALTFRICKQGMWTPAKRISTAPVIVQRATLLRATWPAWRAALKV